MPALSHDSVCALVSGVDLEYLTKTRHHVIGVSSKAALDFPLSLDFIKDRYIVSLSESTWYLDRY